MTHVAIMDMLPDGRVTKFASFATLPDAEAHVAEHAANFPQAFAAPDPGGAVSDWRVDAGALILDPQVPVITSEMVNEERARRIAAGATVTVAGIGLFDVQTDPESREKIAGLASVGLIRKVSGLTDTTTFRDANNNDRVLDPDQLIEMGMQVAARVDAIFKASWAIKALDPIPAEYADDIRWP